MKKLKLKHSVSYTYSINKKGRLKTLKQQNCEHLLPSLVKLRCLEMRTAIKPVNREDIRARERNIRKSEGGAVMATDRAIPKGESLLTS